MPKARHRAHPICLLTDFGLADPYVAQMKGAILGRLPQAALVDISHDVPPYALPTAALLLAASRPHFPAGAVFVCVVDPGVGTERRIVAVEKDGQTILAPDNGLLGPVLAAPGEMRAYDLSAHADAPGVSATFHGRDVFAPLAARIAAGESPSVLGPEIPPASLERLPWARPRWDRDERIVHAAVLHVDRFGNAVTNIPADAHGELAAWGRLILTAETTAHSLEESPANATRLGPQEAPISEGGPNAATGERQPPALDAPTTAPGPHPAEGAPAPVTTAALANSGKQRTLLVDTAHSYAGLPPGALALIAGSQGHLELAMNQASAAKAAGLAPGTPFTLGAARHARPKA